MSKRKKRRRGDIIWVDLGQHPGRYIQSGKRPCLIVNTNRSNAEVYTVMPGTCKISKMGFPVHVTVTPKEVHGMLNQTTIFMAEQLVTVDESQVLLKVGHIDKKSGVMERVNEVLLRQMGMEEYCEKTG